MGLKTAKRTNTTYLTIAGGLIWNKSADKNDTNYRVQKWTDMKGQDQERSGAAYDELDGLVTNVYTKVHPEYGEAIYVTLSDGDDEFTLNIKTNTANSQHIMKALLMLDLEKEILIKPYDFTPKDGKKRQVGLNFFQDGVKLDKNKFPLPKEWQTNKEFWLPSNKKKFTRFLEDFSDWLVSEIEEKVRPKLGNMEETHIEETPTQQNTVQETNVSETISPIKMKKYLKEYISENYKGKELPKLSKEEIIVWYNLALETEELPFEKEEVVENVEDEEVFDVEDDDLQKQLDELAEL